VCERSRHCIFLNDFFLCCGSNVPVLIHLEQTLSLTEQARQHERLLPREPIHLQVFRALFLSEIRRVRASEPVAADISKGRISTVVPLRGALKQSILLMVSSKSLSEDRDVPVCVCILTHNSHHAIL
jgi:hypothetical protein